ncbi:complement C3 isoform X2 [Bombina bombina]|uniref:complement C3 isoform X2 n=1 Tax=Bombina bombina TaxID=8345 RepID=UPI00235A4810|nr:complement C3 isoform X2 [Bombina bombina]
MMECGILCALLFLISTCYSQPQCTLITPSVLHVENNEIIVLDAQGHNSSFDAEISIQTFPRKTVLLSHAKVSLNKHNGFMGTVTIKVPFRHFRQEQEQYVYVTAKSPLCTLEKVILVSFQSGYIFIQSNFGIYTPGSHVLVHIFSMNNNLQPKINALRAEILNPDGATEWTDVFYRSNSGITSASYRIPDAVSLGTWTILAYFEGFPQHTFSTNFEVKEYVLPRFEVSLKPEKNVYSIDDKEFRVQIVARYLFGKPVNGKAFVLFGVKSGDQTQILKNSLKRVEITKGNGQAVMKQEDLLKYFPYLESVVGNQLYVTVTVITDSGSDIVEAQLENIFIVTSPYKILFTKTPKYFKPGLPYDLLVYVTNPDGSPAVGVPVVAKPFNIRGITKEEGIVRLKLSTRSDAGALLITVGTEHRSLAENRQATASLTVTPYRSSAGPSNYLHISVSDYKLTIYDNAGISFHIHNGDPGVQKQIQHITYLVLSKGTIVSVQRLNWLQGQTFLSVSIPVTMSLMPSFRIVAYYMVVTAAGREIVSDSVWLEVVDSCAGKLEVTGARDEDNNIQHPGNMVKLKLKADYKAEVGLAIVDKRLNWISMKYRLSQSKVWSTVAKSDTGCSPGSGADTAGVFYDAGLSLKTNFKMETAHRSEIFCKILGKRNRRSLQNENKKDGKIGFVFDDIKIRTAYVETLFWRVEKLNERPNASGISTKTMSAFLNDRITTWEVLAVSLSETKGLCVSQPYEIVVAKDFFIDLKLPYSVLRNEQVEIQAIVYNYMNREIKVRLELSHNDDLCIVSMNKTFYQEVLVEPFASVTVPYVLVPLTLGLHDVEVKAGVYGIYMADVVRKRLNVVPAGILVIQNIKSATLEPETKGKDGVQEERIPIVDAENILPQSEILTIITVKGYEKSKIFNAIIGAYDLSSLLIKPSGSGEENIMKMAYSTFTTYYLDTVGDWGQVGANKILEAIEYITMGYHQQLRYRKSDGSYGTSTGVSSTWLTAYVVKVFLVAYQVHIDFGLLCDEIKWLILEKQRPDGNFKEDKAVLAKQMMGGVSGSQEQDITLSSFILIVILESKRICDVHVNNLHYSIERASNFLLRHYPTLRTPYSVAITSYALSLANKLEDPKTLLKAATDNTHWADQSSSLVTVEATSYALLALLRMKRLDLARPVARWLTDQTFNGKVDHESLQATTMRLQALAKYEISTPLDNWDMSVTIDFPMSYLVPISFHITKENYKQRKTARTHANKEMVVRAQGKGQASLTVSASYYTPMTEKDKECNNFDVFVTAERDPTAQRPKGAKETVSITVCVRHLKFVEATMSVIDVSMLTGFTPDVGELYKLMKEEISSVSKFELNKGASARSNVIIYMDKISHIMEECLTFHAHKFFDVGLIQPASATVYEYSSPENRCTKFYHMEKDSAQLKTICYEGVCRCVEAYKVTLDDLQTTEQYDKYVMMIKTVLKDGTEEHPEGKKRNFISHKTCREALNLKIGQDYLIWGSSVDFLTEQSQYAYLIGRNTWIEWWPNESECQKLNNFQLCEDLSNLSESLTFFGCLD